MRYFAKRSFWQVYSPRELWHYRELAWILGLRDIQVRYKQTLIGVAWAVLQPLIMLGIFVMMFGLLGRSPASDQRPYALSALCGIVAWQFLAGGLMESARSMVANQPLITKVYFPRVLLLVSTKLAGLVELSIGVLLLLGFMVYLAYWPSWQIVCLPAVVLLAGIASLGIGLWLAALNATYRDVQYALPFVLQAGFFLSPVAYETDVLIPPAWRTLYAINPAVCVLEGFRWCLLGANSVPYDVFLPSLAVNCLLVVSGAWYFQRMERHFADRV